MYTRQVQINFFFLGGGGYLVQKVNEEVWEAKPEQQLILCTESKMKEFDEHFVESPFEGVKAKVKWIGKNGV
jgi:hypothetical protein